MSLPQNIQLHLQNNHGITVNSQSAVSGGSINQAVRLATDQGDLFLKFNNQAPDDFFIKEAEGLSLLKSAASDLRIPDIVAVQDNADGVPGFLLMEYIESNSTGDSEAFGAELARLHQTQSERFGLDSDNYIGSLPQSNRHHNEWIAFFSEERIKPQLTMAVESGKIGTYAYEEWELVVEKLSDILPETKPCLVHGDLWSGNYLFDSSGRAVLIDPAVYYGHPEMDLAFSKMFGGFSRGFYDGYASVNPIEHGFDERMQIYNLYPLLVHVNLFGGHYISQAKGVLARFS